MAAFQHLIADRGALWRITIQCPELTRILIVAGAAPSASDPKFLVEVTSAHTRTHRERERDRDRSFNCKVNINLLSFLLPGSRLRRRSVQGFRRTDPS
jgi:hypothetical protein